ITAWSQRNPGHPGAVKAALVRASDATLPLAGAGAGGAGAGSFGLPASLSGGYALLVPVSGNLASAGRAVRGGFIAAWFAAPEPRRPLRIYDTGNEGTQALQAYQQALRDGASTVIGPLTKEGVAAVAQQAGSVAWLTLNYLDGPIGGALQFGLAP